MGVGAGETHHEPGDVLGERILVVRSVGDEHLLDAGDRSRGLCDCATTRASDQYDDIASDPGGSAQGVER